MEELDKLCKKLSLRPEIRRIYIVDQRSGARPDENQGLEIVLQVSDVTEHQKKDILEIIRDSPVKLSADPIWLGQAAPHVREFVLENGKLLYDQSASPTSPT